MAVVSAINISPTSDIDEKKQKTCDFITKVPSARLMGRRINLVHSISPEGNKLPNTKSSDEKIDRQAKNYFMLIP